MRLWIKILSAVYAEVVEERQMEIEHTDETRGGTKAQMLETLNETSFRGV
jgi:hypothetical protein